MVVNTATGNIVGYIKAQMAAEERRKIAERSKRGKLAIAERGRWPGSNHVRYGYAKSGSGKTAQLRTDDATAAIVKRIFADFVGQGGKQPMPTRGIAVKLNREGIPAPRGGVWVPIKNQRHSQMPKTTLDALSLIIQKSTCLN